MAWAFQSVGTITNSSTGTIAPAIPATYQAGSLLLMMVATNTSITTAVTGWTNIVNNTGGASNTSLAIWYKIAASASETAPTVTLTSGIASGVILAYTGIQGYNSVSTVATTSLQSTANCTTNTTSTALYNDLVLSIYAISGFSGANTVSFSTPTGTTLRTSQTASSSVAGFLIADETQQNTGTTTARTSTGTKSGAQSVSSAQFQVSLKSVQTNFFRMF